ncbi:hypothetical protein HED34_07220 [Vagococcus fluvialis]|uniref:glycosyltransferase n=1 Tax=Vagococcus fluvialis TaxID=2738 RepID=UPI001432997F|nr:glycosyltransferase [Vagococcus fluvialis]NKC59756.1 hypothetical protein [Vagococcus fluvialis]NKD50653.1 hypothetical protein [Vagococcus fluvialis]
MDLEVLISTLENDNGIKLYKKMNLVTDAIIINQTDQVSYNKNIIDEKKVEIFSFNERGIGLSRTNALMRSSSDICVMADDDMVYRNEYKETIINAYKNNPTADMIVFNVIVHKNGEKKETVKKNGKVRFINCLSYGTVMFTFKRESILKNNITFSLLFGGGAKYGAGEDSLFIWEVLKAKLNVISSTEIIADVYNEESTWFKGYNDKYFYDKGALFRALSPKFYLFFIIQFILRHKGKFNNDISRRNIFKIMRRGAIDY